MKIWIYLQKKKNEKTKSYLCFSHCCQYSGVCISDNLENVRSKANNSSSPVNKFDEASV